MTTAAIASLPTEGPLAPILAQAAELAGENLLLYEPGVDGIVTLWLEAGALGPVAEHLRSRASLKFPMLVDLFVIDERLREHRGKQPTSDFTLVVLLAAVEPDAWLRLKVPLLGERPRVASLTPAWPAANWYEREAFDMFGVEFIGHPHLRRILMPPTWEGHPLRKEHPARATELTPYTLSERRIEDEQAALRLDPAHFGRGADPDNEFMWLNLGPQHPGTHGVLRVGLLLSGEEIVDLDFDIGYHHRGAEKMGERQSWHSYIPYTDRIDYLGGVMNNLAYLLPLEQLAGIEVPPRAQVIRVMLCELFRFASHLVWYGTFAQDLGALSPVFYLFNDRERVFDLVTAVCGGRMHPAWFRIGGVAADLPPGWEEMFRAFLAEMPKRIKEYDRLLVNNHIFRARTRGIGSYSTAEALAWGVTGPGLRATGLAWDLRRARPYAGYEQFDFEVPVGVGGDCFARAQVRIEEMRQSLKIIAQCVDRMPPGPVRADHPLATPPDRKRMLHDIETLIHHFLAVSMGPVIPVGEAFVPIEASKGLTGYHLISDGGTQSYRTRIRTPSFAHLQMAPRYSRGLMIPDLMAILGSIDYVLADVDR